MVTALRRLRAFFRSLHTLWSLAGVTLIAVLLTEGALRMTFALKDRLAAVERPDPRVIAEGYGGESWLTQHFRELDRLSDRWQPYTYFRQRPFRGKTISIDEEGHRATWQPTRTPTGDPEGRIFKVLMLGGSSLWGFGARDDHTIPSLVARKLHERGHRVGVRNLAEIGYVNTQEVVALLREIQSGYRPDLVIFYDGINDSTSALLEGEAGVTTNERNRRDEFNIRQSPARLGAAMIARLVQDSACFRFAQVIGRRLLAGRRTGANLPAGVPGPGLVSEVVRRYRANLAIIDKLGGGFGFKALFFWQPVVFEKSPLTSYEHEEAEKFGWARGFVLDVYRAIRSSSDLAADPRFHDLGRLFADAPDLAFIDYCHTTESANERIADAMAARIVEVLPSTSRDRRDGDSASGPVR